jgi:uncharacterized membrane protein YvbJ
MNCPSCGRSLATGAQKCSYCGHGTTFRPKQQLNIPKGTVPEHKKSSHFGRWILIIIVIAGVAAWFTPAIRNNYLQPLVDKVKGMVEGKTDAKSDNIVK